MLDLSKIEPISKEPFEFGPIQTKWLEALESGNYKQGKGYLKDKDGYCCLGVLCEVMGLEASPGDEKQTYFKFGDSVNAAYVPLAAVPLAGLRSSAGGLKWGIVPHGTWKYGSLTGLNDEAKLSFAEIAAYIRHDPHNVFEHAA